jgi:hypothetical protein
MTDQAAISVRNQLPFAIHGPPVLVVFAGFLSDEFQIASQWPVVKLKPQSRRAEYRLLAILK